MTCIGNVMQRKCQTIAIFTSNNSFHHNGQKNPHEKRRTHELDLMNALTHVKFRPVRNHGYARCKRGRFHGGLIAPNGTPADSLPSPLRKKALLFKQPVPTLDSHCQLLCTGSVFVDSNTYRSDDFGFWSEKRKKGLTHRVNRTRSQLWSLSVVRT